jgi:hypothetical protein
VSAVFCDWLDVTFSPLEKLPWAEKFFRDVGGAPYQQGDNSVYTLSNGGKIHFNTKKRFQRVSISGKVLEYMRNVGAMNVYLRHLTDQPHKVTRLDAALDFRIDAAPVVRRLVRKYGKIKIRLSDKPVSTSHFLEARDDGQLTGTFYAGNRRHTNITARVYDKEHQMRQQFGIITEPWLRYEITVKTGAVTLRDVHNPASVFWHYASPALLQAPSDVQSFTPGNPCLWEPPPPEPEDLKSRLVESVKYSDDVNRWLYWADQVESGRDYLLKILTHRITRG